MQIDAIGKRIRQLREEKGLSMADLAKAASVSRSLICQVEKGTAFPSLPTLEKIANALAITMSKLFTIEPHADNGDDIVDGGEAKKI